MTYPVDRLLESAKQVTLSQPSDRTKADTFHHGYRRNKDDRFFEVFDWVLQDFAPVALAWLSHIEPGGDIPSHIDASPWLERWQVPIQTSGVMIVDGEEISQEPGVPFRVEHWKPHSVTVGERPRIHLVIDRDVVAREGKGNMVRLDA